MRTHAKTHTRDSQISALVHTHHTCEQYTHKLTHSLTHTHVNTHTQNKENSNKQQLAGTSGVGWGREKTSGRAWGRCRVVVGVGGVKWW